MPGAHAALVLRADRATVLRARGLTAEMLADPIGAHVSIVTGDIGFETARRMVSIRVRSGEVRMPIIGEWPLDDLTVLGLHDRINAILGDSITPEQAAAGGYDDWLSAHARIAVCHAVAEGDGFDDAMRDRSDGLILEMCIDALGRPLASLRLVGDDLPNRSIGPHPDVVTGIAGPMPLPCWMRESPCSTDGGADGPVRLTMSPIADHEDGIEIRLAIPDATEILRVVRLIAEQGDPDRRP